MSHIAQIAMIIAVSTAILAAASVVVSSARWPLAKTAAMATQAFGLAMPRSVPPATENVLEAAVGSASGGAVAMWYASQRMYATEIQIRMEPIAGTARSSAVIAVATARSTIVVPTKIAIRYEGDRDTPQPEPGARPLMVAGPGPPET